MKRNNKKYLNPPNLINPTHKICYKCHKRQKINNFNKCSTGVYGIHNHCRKCQKVIKKKWYEKNKEHSLEYAKIYQEKNLEKIQKSRKKRWEENKHILGPLQNERRRKEPAKIKARIQRKKWMEIPQNKISQNLRSRIRAAIKYGKKYQGTEELLGCSYEKAVEHLESQFQKDMTWQNYGKGGWHIDHIIPCSSFDLTDPEQQKKCFHYTNLQPLWEIDNIRKGNKINDALYLQLDVDP